MAELEQKIDRLLKKVEDIESSIETIKKGDITVSVKTIGRGFQIWSLADIIQTIWDRPKDTFDRAADYSGKASKIITLLKTITMFIITGMIITMFITNLLK